MLLERSGLRNGSLLQNILFIFQLKSHSTLKIQQNLSFLKLKGVITKKKKLYHKPVHTVLEDVVHAFVCVEPPPQTEQVEHPVFAVREHALVWYVEPATQLEHEEHTRF